MNIVSFGGGTNSAALLIGLYKHKIPIDLITFADTGAEHPHTYQFIEIINQWLAEHGMPQITVVQYVDRYGNRLSLETECLRSHTLPSIAYGHKRCSQKHKIAPQEKFCNHYAPCREVWQRGEKVNRYIGYDAGEVKRYEHSRKYNEADKKYHNRYPLIEEWGWNRDDCIREIKAAGLQSVCLYRSYRPAARQAAAARWISPHCCSGRKIDLPKYDTGLQGHRIPVNSAVVPCSRYSQGSAGKYITRRLPFCGSRRIHFSRLL